MRIAPNVSAMLFILSSVFISSAPVLAASTGGTGSDTGSPANNGTASPGGDYGKTTGAGEVQHIQQMLNDAEIKTSATASGSENVGTISGNSAASSQPANELPFTSNEGTLAESANTTALSTSTYHQSTGLIPGWRWAP
jgi:hypothetical protein